MSKYPAEADALELLFSALVETGVYCRGFNYHPLYGIVGWSLVPRGIDEEEFESGCTFIAADDYVDDLIEAMKKSPMR